ncbi:LCP family protein [Streptomyces sp. NBC_01525]|uniref:LCP family protein n=1 Tax=Streptomyces sp. NBC_01525 TaxID=2903893 RepID=UPI0038693786
MPAEHPMHDTAQRPAAPGHASPKGRGRRRKRPDEPSGSRRRRPRSRKKVLLVSTAAVAALAVVAGGAVYLRLSAFTLGSTASGNPACTQNTVEALTGLRINHTVVVNFAGFAAMTEAVGGVPVCLPKDIHQKDLDPNRLTQGRTVYRKGEQKVSGKAALDYVRLRHGLGDGSDIGRTKRQQAFVSSLISQVKKEGFGPTTLLPLANAATKSLTVDPGLGSASKLLSFAMSLKNVDLADIQFLTVPWKYSGPRTALVHPDADNLWSTLKEDRTLEGKATGQRAQQKKTDPASTARAVSGAGITVAVYNGTTTRGLAARRRTRAPHHRHRPGTPRQPRSLLRPLLRLNRSAESRRYALATVAAHVATHYGLYNTVSGPGITLGNLATGTLWDRAARHHALWLTWAAPTATGLGCAAAVAALARTGRLEATERRAVTV